MNFKTIIIGVSLFVLYLSNIVIGKDKEIEQVFINNKITGTMVIQSLDGRDQFIHNNKRAKERMMPGETFEIPLSLITLSTKKNKDKDGEEYLARWDGNDKGAPEWNRDQILQTAFSTSCTWYFQDMALRIGEKVLGSHLRKIGYGNKSLKYDFTTCWFDGRLEISALEQIAFIKKFYTKKLPYSEPHIELITELMPLAKTPAYTLRAKKGIVKSILPNIGWYLGFVETDGNVYFFATNMDLPDSGGPKYPWTITKQSLKAKKIF